MGVSPDSVTYIGAARALASGHGYCMPVAEGGYAAVTQFPPLFSGVLACFGMLGIDPLHGARGLNAILFGLNTFLIAVLVWRYSRSPGCAILGCLLFVTSIQILRAHAHVWSEPVFILFMLLGLLLLQLYIDSNHQWPLISAALILGLSCLNRYAGVALVWTGMAATLLLSTRAIRLRFRDFVVFSTIASLPLILWLARNVASADSMTARSVSYHPFTRAELSAALQFVFEWTLVPWSSPVVIRLIVPLLVLGIMVYLSTKNILTSLRSPCRSRPGSGIPHLFIIASVCYVVLLTLSKIFIEAGIRPPEFGRLLSPLYALTVVAFVCSASFLISRLVNKMPYLPAVAALIAVFLIAGACVPVAEWAIERSGNGDGYTRRYLRTSNLLHVVSSLPSNTPIYSNAPDLIYFTTGRPSSLIPEETEPGSLLPSKAFEKKLSSMKTQLETRGGVIVFADAVAGRWYLPSEENLRNRLGLHLQHNAADGRIYSSADTRKTYAR